MSLNRKLDTQKLVLLALLTAIVTKVMPLTAYQPYTPLATLQITASVSFQPLAQQEELLT